MTIHHLEKKLNERWETTGRIPKVVVLSIVGFRTLIRDIEGWHPHRKMELAPNVMSLSFDVGDVIVLPKTRMVDWSYSDGD